MKMDKKKVFSFGLKTLRYLVEGFALLFFAYFIIIVLRITLDNFIGFKQFEKEFKNQNYFLSLLVFFVFSFFPCGIFNIPLAAFLSHRVDKIEKKIKTLKVKAYSKSIYKYFLLKSFLAIPIALFTHFPVNTRINLTGISLSYSLYFIDKIFKIINSSITSFKMKFIFPIAFVFLPLIYIFLVTYLLKKFLIFYYKKKDLKSN